MDNFDREHPYLINLHDRLGYLDDDRNPITIEEQQVMVKKKFGDDVFDIANAKISPEAIKFADQVMKIREDTKGMNLEEGIEYLKTVNLNDFKE
jgi:hypothetical protein